MPPSPLSRRQLLGLTLLGLVLVGGLGGTLALFLLRSPVLPAPGSDAYEDYVERFQTGTARLDIDMPREALEQLSLAVERIPGEPAGWANRGLLYLRTNQLDEAASDLGRARSLAPNHPAIEEMLGHLAEQQGNLPLAITHFERAQKAAPEDVRLMYKLAQLVEAQGADEQRLIWLDTILQYRPTSLPVLVQKALTAARLGNRAKFTETLNQFQRLSGSWNETQRQGLVDLQKLAEGGITSADFQLQLGRFGNGLQSVVGYSRALLEVSPPPSQVGSSLHQFVKLAPLTLTAAAPDPDVSFTTNTLAAFPPDEPGAAVVTPVWLTRSEPATLLVSSSKRVRLVSKANGQELPFPSGQAKVSPTQEGIVAIDFDSDFRQDLVLAGAGGLAFWHSEPGGQYREVSASTKLPAATLQGDYHGGWSLDVDMDGDLDLILAPRKGEPLLLRNNFDGTWLTMPIFPGVDGLRALAWADLDNDGAPDAALLDQAGRLHIFMNERTGLFRRRESPDQAARYSALCAADVNDDGLFDLVVLDSTGTLVRISDRDKGKSWDVASLSKLPQHEALPPGTARLLPFDLDGNGTLDVILRTPRGGTAWLSDASGAFIPLRATVPAGLGDFVLIDDKGSVACFGISPDGLAVVQNKVQGKKGYSWFAVRPRATDGAGPDQRINAFAIGTEMEVRSGTQVCKQMSVCPDVLFGLGTRKRAQIIRMVWTNGATQIEFDRPADSIITAEQRLKGSCPFLFTWDGKRMAFVTDFCWSTPLGLYINAQKRAEGFVETTEWVRVPGQLLQPRKGIYDVRVQANLWETHYLDQLGLMVVDHPPDTEIHCDERFFLQPTRPRLYLTGPSRPVARARDSLGKDVTELIRQRDGKYLEPGAGGIYQGTRADHWVEVHLGNSLPKGGPIYLIASGWLHPTDSSINFALSQGSHAPPMPLTLEVPDGQGGWKQALPPLGFLAGKNKTMVLRLDDLPGGVPTTFRLRTSMAIYWDSLAWARGLEPAECQTQLLEAESAQLRYRGIVAMRKASASSPEIPDYDDLVTGEQVWRDLIGFHTRPGDVRELIEKVDDRYVLMNAGDEIRLTYRAPAAQQSGWLRDFIWVSDGWTKDGDFNTRFGKTVLPLPYHGMKEYATAPGRLEDDPVYRRFRTDWDTYHTRWIESTRFERGLRTNEKRRP